MAQMSCLWLFPQFMITAVWVVIIKDDWRSVSLTEALHRSDVTALRLQSEPCCVWNRLSVSYSFSALELLEWVTVCLEDDVYLLACREAWETRPRTNSHDVFVSAIKNIDIPHVWPPVPAESGSSHWSSRSMRTAAL